MTGGVPSLPGCENLHLIWGKLSPEAQARFLALARDRMRKMLELRTEVRARDRWRKRLWRARMREQDPLWTDTEGYRLRKLPKLPARVKMQRYRRRRRAREKGLA